MQVWNVLRAARWKYRTQKVAKNRHLGTIAQLCRAISSQLRHVSTIGKKLVKQRYVLHTSPQYGEIRPTNGWDPSGSLRQPCKFPHGFASWQRYCTASSSGRQPNFAALNRGRHLCSAGRPSGWALAHILVYCCIVTVYANQPKIWWRLACQWFTIAGQIWPWSIKGCWLLGVEPQNSNFSQICMQYFRYFAPKGWHYASITMKFDTEEHTIGLLSSARFHPGRWNGWVW